MKFFVLMMISICALNVFAADKSNATKSNDEQLFQNIIQHRNDLENQERSNQQQSQGRRSYNPAMDGPIVVPVQSAATLSPYPVTQQSVDPRIAYKVSSQIDPNMIVPMPSGNMAKKNADDGLDERMIMPNASDLKIYGLPGAESLLCLDVRSGNALRE